MQAEAYFSSNLEINEINEFLEKFRVEFVKKFQNAEINIEKLNDNLKVLSNNQSKKFLNSIINFKHGVFSQNESGLVTTSVNLGVVDLEENIFKIGARSSKKIEEEKMLKYLKEYAKINKYEFVILGYQPGFETKENSKIVESLTKSYNKVIGDNKLNIKPVHITVESGFFTNKIPGLEVAIISPNIIGAHTTFEKVEIKSIIECDKWIYEFLNNLPCLDFRVISSNITKL